MNVESCIIIRASWPGVMSTSIKKWASIGFLKLAGFVFREGRGGGGGGGGGVAIMWVLECKLLLLHIPTTQFGGEEVPNQEQYS